MTIIYFNYKKYFVFSMAALLAGTMLLSGCGKSARADNNADANKTADKTVEVTTARAEIRPVGSYLQATGSLLADDSSDVSSQVSGQVYATPVDTGVDTEEGGSMLRRTPSRSAPYSVPRAVSRGPASIATRPPNSDSTWSIEAR